MRSRHQFWIFTYPSMYQILHSASILQRTLDEVRKARDPHGLDPALSRVVLVGHSLGGILAKSLVRDVGDSLWSLVGRVPLSEIDATDDQRLFLEQVFHFNVDPGVFRVVSIATPHRGSPPSIRILGRISAGPTPHKGPLADTYADIRRSNPPSAFTPEFLREGLATSFDQLRPGDPVLDVLDRTPIPQGVAVHSIIAQKHPGPPESGFDGVMYYDSSHIDLAESELIVPHHHFVQGEPETIAELKRILKFYAP